MNTTYRFLCLALLLASAPFPANAQPEQVATPAKRNQTKSPQDKTNTQNKYLQDETNEQDPYLQDEDNEQNKYLQAIGITIVIGTVVSIAYLLYHTHNGGPVEAYKASLKENNAAKQYYGNALYRASIDPNDKKGTTFRQAVREAVKKKDATEGTWQTWITKKDDELVNTLAHIFKAKKWDITSTQGGTNGEVAQIGNLEQGMINAPGSQKSHGAAYGLAQVLHLLIQVSGKQTMKKLVQQNNNRFLANLVDSNIDIPCRESIYVLLNLGGADPTARPSFGNSNNDLFFNNKGQNAQTIQQIAAQGNQGRNRLEIKKNNDQWTVANVPNNNNS